jgi:hypothetical protein
VPKNYIKYFYFFVLVFFVNSPFVFALETTYPSFPGIPGLTTTSKIEDYISYFFKLGIMSAGILAVIFLSIGAIRLMTSAGNPSVRTDSIDAIKGSLLGLILIIVSVLILQTINPKIAEITLEPLPYGDGIFYAKGDDRLPAPMSESNTANVPKGYDKLIYVCSSGPTLFIWKFSKTNFEGIDDAYVIALDCGESTAVTGVGSFKMAFETTGIYYCMKDCSESGTVCSGYMSGANTASGQLPEPFKGKLKSVLFVNDLPSDIKYGAIFHETDDPTSVGVCSLVYNKNPDKKRVCVTIGNNPSSSISVFAWNAKTPETSGTGVTFYSEPWGETTGARAGKYFLSKKYIRDYFNTSAYRLVFDYTGVNRPQKYKQLYQNFNQHPGSIYLEGNYLVQIKSSELESAPCQVFFKDIFNIYTTEFLAKKNIIDNLVVIPIK